MANVGRKRLARNGATKIRLHFLGANRTVTGSLHFLEVTQGDKTIRFFVDMGLCQEHEHQYLNWQNRLPTGIKPADVAFGIFTHAHIDHIGFLPKLVKDGFKGPVYATAATRELAEILLPDCAFLQENEARLNKNRKQRHQEALADKKKNNAKQQNSKKKKAGSQKAKTKAETAKVSLSETPLYTSEDAHKALAQIHTVDFQQETTVAEGITIRFVKASHLLGAASLVLEIGTGTQKRTICFSGDIGRPNMPIIQNAEKVEKADYVVCEGTYGKRLHPERNRLQALADIINRSYRRANVPHKTYGYGVILIPAFAVGRVQSVLYDLRQLMEDGLIPEIPVFVDSPMAIRTTNVYRKHKDLYNGEAAEVASRCDPFRTPVYAELMESSQSLRLDEPASQPIIVVSSSGMAVGGRIMHHLQKRLPGRQHSVIFVGYQAEGTLGRHLMNPTNGTARVLGKEVSVRAGIEYLEDYSGHADYKELLQWLKNFKQKPKKLFLVHGDEESLESMKAHIQQKLKWNAEIPQYRDAITLD